MAGIKICFLIIILYLGYFNTQKSYFCVKKPAIGQQIILSKNVISQKNGLVTITLTLRYCLVINKIYNTRLPTIKVSTIMKI